MAADVPFASEFWRSHQIAHWKDAATPARFPPVRRTMQIATSFGSSLIPWVFLHKRRDPERKELGRRIRVTCERLGPTFIKQAQILSFAEGVFADGFLAELKRCRDDASPVPVEAIQAIVEADLGCALADTFQSFESKAIATASIAQVHEAILRDGTSVVVKVQRPDIRDLVARDLQAIAWIVRFARRFRFASVVDPQVFLDVFAETLAEELDFRLEAANAAEMARSVDRLGRSDSVLVPKVESRFSQQRVLVLERLDGIHFDDSEAMRSAGLETADIVETVMFTFLEGVFLDGFFHGDLHGGNLKILPTGQVVMLDFGIVGRLGESERHAFLRFMIAAITNNFAGQLAAFRDLGALPHDIDLDEFAETIQLGGLDPVTADPRDLATSMQRLLHVLVENGARVPKCVVLYMKNLFYIEGAIANLNPDLDLVQVMNKVALHFSTRHARAISEDLGLSSSAWALDLSGVQLALGADPSTTASMPYREFKARQQAINRKTKLGFKQNLLRRKRPPVERAPVEPQRQTALDRLAQVMMTGIAPEGSEWERLFVDLLEGPGFQYVDNLGAWLATSHDACLTVLRDGSLTPDRRAWKHYEIAEPDPILDPLRESNIFALDKGSHRRIRRMTHHVFTPSAVKNFSEIVSDVVGQIFDQLSVDGFDVATELARPIPLAIINELLAIPDEYKSSFLDYGTALVRFQNSGFVGDKDLETLRDGALLVREIIDRRRSVPIEGDLLTALITTSEAGSTLSTAELEMFIGGLIVAGSETMTSTISYGAQRLLREPEQMSLLRERPELWDNAAHEVLRLEYVAPTMPRFVREPTSAMGQELVPGEVVLLCIPSANLDPAVFERPLQFDATRGRGHGLYFSFGQHFCLGAHLAIMEIGEIFRRLLDLGEVSISGPVVQIPEVGGLRQHASLPVSVSR